MAPESSAARDVAALGEDFGPMFVARDSFLTRVRLSLRIRSGRDPALQTWKQGSNLAAPRFTVDWTPRRDGFTACDSTLEIP